MKYLYSALLLASMACSYDLHGFGTESQSTTDTTDAGGTTGTTGTTGPTGTISPTGTTMGATDTTGSTGAPAPICGDGHVDEGEECDSVLDKPFECHECRQYLVVERGFDEEAKLIPEMPNAVDKPPLDEMACFVFNMVNSEKDAGISPQDSQDYPYVHDVDLTLPIDHPSVGELVVMVLVVKDKDVPGSTIYASAMHRPGYVVTTQDPLVEDGGADTKLGAAQPLKLRSCIPPDECNLPEAEDVGDDVPNGQFACSDYPQCEFKANKGDAPVGLADLSGLVLWANTLPTASAWRVCVQDPVDNASGGTFSPPTMKIRRSKGP